MIALDTNVLIRLLTQDDPKQAAIAAKWVGEAESRKEALFLNRIVLCELVWVLSGAYGFSKSKIIRILEELLSTENLVVENRDIVFEALKDYAGANADFVDYLIGRSNEAEGCSKTLTFDRKLLKTELFGE